MRFDSIIWDLDDDPDGNVHHCGEHGVTKEEVEEAQISAGLRVGPLSLEIRARVGT
jgi:hypothetical protein